MSAKLTTIEAALGRLGATGRTTGASMGQMATGVAAGTIAAHALMGVAQAVVGSLAGMGKGAIDLASRLEQAKIGFTTMLGSAEAADAFIRKLQAFAESTSFSFPGIQQVAQSFMAMGFEAKNVIPVITDISNALAAAGRGGDTEALQRVGMSLSEIAAQGKVTAEQLRELARNGIAVMPMLAAAFGKTTAEIRKMAEAGEISATEFFEAFHSQVASRYGDIQAEQAKTWSVAISNVGDILDRLINETFLEFFDVLTNGALLLQDFLKGETAQVWANEMKSAIHAVMVALEPLGAALQAAMGLPAGPPASVPKAKAPVEASQAMIISPEAINSAKNYDAQIKAATASIHAATAELTGLTAQQDALKITIEDTTKRYELQLIGLKDQQDALNADIEQTKTLWEGVIAPLERVQDQLGRLAEDTKADFAAIMDPLKAGLDQTNRKIQDSKAAFEATVRPIEREIAAIDKATSALTKQRRVQQDLADLKLDQKSLDALGDPTKRAEIAGQLKTLELQRDELERQMDLLQLKDDSKKNDRAMDALQEKLNANKKSELEIQGRLSGLVDRGATAEIAKQEVLNKAKADQLAIDEKTARIAADAQKAPLEEQLAAAKAQLTTLLDPLEALATSLSRAIEDTAAAEAAALAPIIAAQASVARQIEDANQAMQDALAPMEAAQKAIAAQIKEVETAQRKALEPLKEQMEELGRQRDVLELKKKQIQDNIAAWKDEQAQIKATTEEAAKLAKALDLSGGEEDSSVPGHATGTGPLAQFPRPPSELVKSIEELSRNVATLNTNFGNLNATMSAAGVPLANVAEAVGKLAILTVAVGWVRSLWTAITALATGAAATNAIWTLWAAFVVASIDTVRKEWDATDWTKMGADWDAWLAGMTASLDTWNVERTASWNAFWAGLSAAFDGWKAGWDAGWDGVWAGWGEAWTNLQAAPKAAWDTFTGWLGESIPKVVAFFDPLLKVIQALGEAFGRLPASLPSWTGNVLPGGGGGSPFGSAGGSKNSMVEQAAKAFGIDVGVFARQMFQEAGDSLDLGLSSSAGARGPGQFMPGTAREAADLLGVTIDEFWASAELQILGAAATMRKYVDQFGNYQNALAAYNAGPNSPGAMGGQLYKETQEYINRILPTGEPMGQRGPDTRSVAGQLRPVGTITKSQFQLVEEGLSANEAANFCGPYAAMIFANAVGRYPTAVEARALALKAKWTPGQGMGGIDNALALMHSMNIPAVKEAPTAANIDAALGRGEPVGLSTGPHYFTATGGSAAGGMNVGATGTAMKGGKPTMTLAEIEALAGPLQGIINLEDSLTMANAQLASSTNLVADAQIATAIATARAKLGLGEILAPTQAVSGAFQGQTRDLQFNAGWVKTMADQQAALAQVLTGQVDPAMINTKTAMANFGAVLGPIERQVAGGAISLDTLQFKLTDLARATGIATQPFDDFSAGLISQEEAMRRVINAAADVNPQFDALRRIVNGANPDMAKATLDFLQMALNLGKVAPAAAAAVTAVGTVGQATVAATTATTGLTSATGAANNAIDPALLRDAAAASNELAESLAGADRAFMNVQDSAASASGTVQEFLDASTSLGDYLDSHTFDFKVNLPDLPDWAIPGSPMPIETALRSFGREMDRFNHKSVGPIFGEGSSLAMPAPVKFPAGGGGGGSSGPITININGATDPQAAGRAVREELLRIQRNNAGRVL